MNFWSAGQPAVNDYPENIALKGQVIERTIINGKFELLVALHRKYIDSESI